MKVGDLDCNRVLNFNEKFIPSSCLLLFILIVWTCGF
jgi:hypothetical protein